MLNPVVSIFTFDISVPLNLLFFFIKLNGYNPNSTPSSSLSFFFILFYLTYSFVLIFQSDLTLFRALHS